MAVLLSRLYSGPDSASVAYPEWLYEPTVLHEIEDMHDTLARLVPVDSEGSAASWISHSTPFQPSARVTSLSALFSSVPIAVHEVDDEQETPARPDSFAPVGLGVCWIDHSLPFHRSASVMGISVLVS